MRSAVATKLGKNIGRHVLPTASSTGKYESQAHKSNPI